MQFPNVSLCSSDMNYAMTYLQQFWFRLYSNYDPFFLDCLLPYFVQLAVYALTNVPFLILDIYGPPKFLLKYKIQPTKNVPVDTTRYGRVLAGLFVNLVGIGFVMSYIFYYLRRWRGCPIGPQLPPVWEIVWNIAVFGMIEEACFYYSHRFLHTKTMYKAVHKKHHEWNAPIGLMAQYCHPFEHLLSNSFPFLIGPLVCRAHTFTTIIWHVITMYITVIHHCGYKFPFNPSPDFHDYHHENFTQNFGILWILDNLHGTVNKRWKYSFKKDTLNDKAQ